MGRKPSGRRTKLVYVWTPLVRVAKIQAALEDRPISDVVSEILARGLSDKSFEMAGISRSSIQSGNVLSE